MDSTVWDTRIGCAGTRFRSARLWCPDFLRMFTRWPCGRLPVVFAFIVSALFAAPVGNGFAGSAVCSTCHPEVSETFFRNPHFKSVASGKEAPDKTGCEGCHGPGAEHVQSGGVTPMARRFSRLTAAEVQAACLECHAKDLPRVNIRASEHTRSDVVCTNCHSIHHS